MKLGNEKLKGLLAEVLPTPGAEHCGPPCPGVLALVRQERARRQRRRIAMAACATVALVVSLMFWHSEPRTDPIAEAGQPSGPPSAPNAIQQIDDQQLMALLQDTPTALMEWPNGQRTLVVWGK